MGDLLLSSSDRRALHIFKYHQILPEVSAMDGGDLPLEVFHWQMKWVKKNMEVVSLEEGLSLLAEGRLPKRVAAITFDDGYAADASCVVPILKDFGFSATFFISSGYLYGQCMWHEILRIALRHTQQKVLDLSPIQLGRHSIATEQARALAYEKLSLDLKYRSLAERQYLLDHIRNAAGTNAESPELMLNETQVKQLAMEGMEVGSHTVDHPILSCEADSQAVYQIKMDKENLERVVGRPIKYFAYPNGIPGKDFAKRHVEIVRDCGFKAAVTTSAGVVRKNGDYWQLPRFTPWDTAPAKFALRMLRNYSSRSTSV